MKLQSTWPLLALLLASATADYDDDDYEYEEYENVMISGAPEEFEYVYELKLAYEYGVEGEGFGQSVAMNGDRLLVGAFTDPTKGDKAGAAHIFALDSSLLGWTRLCSLSSNDTAAYDYFGWSVSLSNNFALVGAWQNDDVGSNAGAAYFFQKTSDYFKDGKEEWLLHTKVYGWEHDDSFGMAVAIANDNLAAVGSPGGTSADGDYGAGYVSIFRYVGNVWTESDVLEASDASGGYYFGMTLALDASAKLVVVGSYGHGMYGNDRVGTAYVISIAKWGSPSELQLLKAHDAAGGDEFGRSVAINGNTIVVGATGDDDRGDSAGAVYIFEYGYAGGMNTQWAQRSKLYPPDDCTFCYFGAQLAMTNDTLAVGLHGGSEVPGTVLMYKRDLEVDSDFDFIFTLNCTDSITGDQFGSSLFITDSYLAIGALSSNGYDYDTGAVYVYRKEPHYYEDDSLSSMLIASLAVLFLAAFGAVVSYFVCFGSKPKSAQPAHIEMDVSADSRRGLTADISNRGAATDDSSNGLSSQAQSN